MKNLVIITILLAAISCTKKNDQTAKVDFYGLNYQDCLNRARSQTQFTHENMQEETLGHAINNCMSEYGWIMDGKELN